MVSLRLLNAPHLKLEPDQRAGDRWIRSWLGGQSPDHRRPRCREPGNRSLWPVALIKNEAGDPTTDAAKGDLWGTRAGPERVQESGTGRADGAARRHADITAVPVDVFPLNLSRRRSDIVYRADHASQRAR